MNEDGTRCVVAGRECEKENSLDYRICILTMNVALRILKVEDSSQSDGSTSPLTHGKVTAGPGGAQVHSSHNYWKGSGLQIDSTFTDVCWGASCMS